MSVRKVALAASLLGIQFGINPLCLAADPSTAELQAQIKALQDKVNQLEARQEHQEQTSEQAQVNSTIQKVQADAEHRSQLLDMEGFTGGFENDQFVLRSGDGNFSISPVLLWEFRSVINYRDQVNGPGDDQWQNGLETRRARIGFRGNVVNPDLTYYVLFAADNGASASPLDAYVKYQFNPNWAVKFGQFMDPWSHEQNVLEYKQVAVERSMLNAVIGGANTDRVQGVDLIYGDAKPFRTQFVIHDGANSKNTSFVDGPATAVPLLGDANEQWGATGRFEYFAAGTPKQYEDFSAIGNTQNLLVFGAGADLTQGGGNDALFHTFDVAYEDSCGMSLYAEYMGLYRRVDAPSGTALGVNSGNFYDYGFLVQASYMVAPKWELFARWDYTQMDSDAFNFARPIRQSDVHEFTLGFNHYIWQHHAKFTVDVNYLPNGSPFDVHMLPLDYLTTGKSEFVLRGQFTLAL